MPMFVWIEFTTYNSLVVVQVIDGTPGDARFFVALGNLAYAVAANQAGRITAMVNSHFFLARGLQRLSRGRILSISLCT